VHHGLFTLADFMASVVYRRHIADQKKPLWILSDRFDGDIFAAVVNHHHHHLFRSSKQSDSENKVIHEHVRQSWGQLLWSPFT